MSLFRNALSRCQGGFRFLAMALMVTGGWCLDEPGAGTGLRGEYFAGDLAGRRLLVRLDPVVDFAWGSGSPAVGVPVDGFSVQWTGRLLPRETGVHTLFARGDDGVKVWINGVLVLDQWAYVANKVSSATVSLVAGKVVDIRIAHHEGSGNAFVRLEWQGPTLARQVIPASQLIPATVTPGTPTALAARLTSDDAVALTWTPPGDQSAATVEVSRSIAGGAPVVLGSSAQGSWMDRTAPMNASCTYTVTSVAEGGGRSSGTTTALSTPQPPGNGTGLRGEYFSGKTLNCPLAQRIDPAIAFDWLTGGPLLSGPVNVFSIRWSGTVVPRITGKWTFTTKTDDGVRLWVDDILLVDRWKDQSVKPWSGAVTLRAGVPVRLRMEYYENYGLARASLLWQGPNQPAMIIPTSQLYPQDILDPWVPAGLKAQVEPAQTTLTWKPGYDNVGVSSYRIFRADTPSGTPRLLGTTANTTWSDVSALPGPASYTIQAVDAAGHQSTPSVPVTVVRPLPPANGTGLLGRYFRGKDLSTFIIAHRDPLIQFTWNGTAPRADVPATVWSARWTGFLVPRYSERYMLTARSDDGVRVTCGTTKIIDQWKDQSLRDASGSLDLVAGSQVPIVIDYYQNLGTSGLTLRWASAHQAAEVIPTSQLFPPADAPPPVVHQLTAAPDVVTGTTTTLRLAAADSQGREGLVPQFTLLEGPAPVEFTDPRLTPPTSGTPMTEGTWTSQATFHASGIYRLRGTVTNPTGQSVTRDIVVTVSSTLAHLGLEPRQVP